MYTGFGSIGLPIGRYVVYYTITKAQVTLQIKVARLQLFPSAHLRHLRFAGLWWALGRQTKIKGSKMEVAVELCLKGSSYCAGGPYCAHGLLAARAIPRRRKSANLSCSQQVSPPCVWVPRSHAHSLAKWTMSSNLNRWSSWSHLAIVCVFPSV